MGIFEKGLQLVRVMCGFPNKAEIPFFSVKCNFKAGKSRLFYDLDGNYKAVALVGLPKCGTQYNEKEELNERKEGIRIASSAGCRNLQDVGVSEIFVESLGDEEAAAEGAHLGVWKFTEMKSKQEPLPTISGCGLNDEKAKNLWETGVINATSQNIARRLSDMPANLMTPTIFCSVVSDYLRDSGIEIIAHDERWAKEKKMGAFLSVAAGSSEPPMFLEAHYRPLPDQAPIVLVGKGITFDSGGISLKSSKGMDEMRADMGGAASIIGTLHAVSKLKIPQNITALIPLCENMPGGKATKPGDVVIAMNGKTIQVDNTDAEGRLILADALCYAASFNPKFTLDIATLTGAIEIAIGDAACGVFTNSNALWEILKNASAETGDRVWRMPLWKHFTNAIKENCSADMSNIGGGQKGGSCTAAAFLSEFSPSGDWLHLDMAGVMGPSDATPYLHKGMTGRPTRTLIQFVKSIPRHN